MTIPTGATGATGASPFNSHISVYLQSSLIVTAGANVKLPTVNLNAGTAISYNASTGVFTFNTTGNYFISYGAAVGLVGGRIALELNGSTVLAGSGLSQGLASLGGTNYWVSGSIISSFVAGDTLALINNGAVSITLAPGSGISADLGAYVNILQVSN